MKTVRNLLGLLVVMGFLGHCNHWGTAVSAGKTAGHALGYAAGEAGRTIEGIITGAKIGGTGGAAIGKYMGTQANEIRTDLPKDASVDMTGEAIRITYPGDSLFKDSSSTAIIPAAKTHLDYLASTLRKFKNTNVIVAGYTDQSSDLHKNVAFSNDMAKSVAQYLEKQKVAGDRIKYVGYGVGAPTASNNASQGRRIEMAIVANDSLKLEAMNGQLQNYAP